MIWDHQTDARSRCLCVQDCLKASSSVAAVCKAWASKAAIEYGDEMSANAFTSLLQLEFELSIVFQLNVENFQTFQPLWQEDSAQHSELRQQLEMRRRQTRIHWSHERAWRVVVATWRKSQRMSIEDCMVLFLYLQECSWRIRLFVRPAAQSMIKSMSKKQSSETWW